MEKMTDAEWVARRKLSAMIRLATNLPLNFWAMSECRALDWQTIDCDFRTERFYWERDDLSKAVAEALRSHGFQLRSSRADSMVLRCVVDPFDMDWSSWREASDAAGCDVPFPKRTNIFLTQEERDLILVAGDWHLEHGTLWAGALKTLVNWVDTKATIDLGRPGNAPGAECTWYQ